jgi:hypothetical protein
MFALGSKMHATRGVRASVPKQQSSHASARTYRYTFFNDPNERRALAAVELLCESDEAAGTVAAELLEKSHAACVEVWSEGHFIARRQK